MVMVSVAMVRAVRVITLCGLESLCKSLVSQHLFLLESFHSEANLHLKHGLRVDNTRPWLALVYKKLSACNDQSLSLL